jgi:hypothetical protein
LLWKQLESNAKEQQDKRLSLEMAKRSSLDHAHPGSAKGKRKGSLLSSIDEDAF